MKLAQRLLMIATGKQDKLLREHETIKHLQRLVWLLIRASGGKIEIRPNVLEDFDPKQALLFTSYDAASGVHVYEAKDARDV